MSALASAALFGLLLGVRHAFEPDHLAAVSTMVAERPGEARGFGLGVLWGFGHTASLMGVGGALFLLKTTMPASVEDGLELLVAAMLIGLGIRAIWQGARPAHGHSHSTTRVAGRSVLVGLTHGLAGSGALTAVAMAAMPTPAACLGYIGLFGVGSAIGMGAMTATASLGMGRLPNPERLQRPLCVAVGLASLALGLFWGAPRVMRLATGAHSPPAVALAFGR